MTGLCFAEWEEQSPWPSLAERRGFSRQDEVVTAHGGKGTLPLADINTEDAADLVYLLAKSVAYPMGNKFLEPTASNGQIVFAVNPVWAKRLGAAFPDVADMEALLFEHAWQPVELWPKAIRRILEEKGRVDSAGRVRLADRSEQFVVVACGGQGGLHAVPGVVPQIHRQLHRRLERAEHEREQALVASRSDDGPNRAEPTAELREQVALARVGGSELLLERLFGLGLGVAHADGLGRVDDVAR